MATADRSLSSPAARRAGTPARGLTLALNALTVAEQDLSHVRRMPKHISILGAFRRSKGGER